MNHTTLSHNSNNNFNLQIQTAKSINSNNQFLSIATLTVRISSSLVVHSHKYFHYPSMLNQINHRIFLSRNQNKSKITRIMMMMMIIIIIGSLNNFSKDQFKQVTHLAVFSPNRISSCSMELSKLHFKLLKNMKWIWTQMEGVVTAIILNIVIQHIFLQSNSKNSSFLSWIMTVFLKSLGKSLTMILMFLAL